MNSPSLNPTQKAAVLHNDSPLLVLAGAGTGKTKVLTEKIIYLINSYLVSSREILAVTFTNKAAGEMKHRIANSIGDESHNIWMGTFHSIATKILKRHPEIVGLKPDFTIIDSDDCLRLIKQISADLDIDPKEFPVKNYQYQIERLKDKALMPEDLSPQHINNLPRFLEVYQNYQNRLRFLNAADFGDLLLYNLKIFDRSEATLEYYQNKFRYILVDEYQDTNNAQYQWLLKLAAKHQSICAVGDDDQSIYSWRGAQIANILRFEQDFANTKIIRLEQNYRSTANILKAASHLIHHNKHRHGKTLWTEKSSGDKIRLLSFLSDRNEAESIAYLIKDFSQQQTKLNNIAILVRAGYQTRCFEEAFMNNSLPYRIVGGLKFYERREIKDAIAYLRIVYNSADDLALTRIINLPKRGIGEAGLSNLINQARSQNLSLFLSLKSADLKGKSKLALNDLVNNLEKWQNIVTTTPLANLAGQILEESGYIKMWHNEKTPDAAARIENIEEFINSLNEFSSLAEFLEHVSLVAGDEVKNQQNDMVNIMTVHSAKGLEFDTVFIPGLEEGVFPSSRSIQERNGLEEERRLLYVAITRAQKSLYLTWAQNRFVFGSMQSCLPSPFLKELPEEILENNYYDNFAYGSANSNHRTTTETPKPTNSLLNKRVFHQKFGYGKVIEIEGEKLKISFEKSDVKTVMKNFVEVT